MALQVVQYADLRLSIDNNPPAYDYHHIHYEEELDIARTLAGDKTSLTDSTDVTSPESKQGSRQEKSKDSSSKSSGRTKNKGANRQTPKSEAKSVSRSNTKEFKEASDLSIQNEDVESDGKSAAKTSVASTRNSKRASTNLETVQEKQFTDAYSLTDEKSWSSVPTEDIPGRFLQYRQLSRKALKEVETNLDTTVNKTQRKVQTLKTQFQEHKVKWEEERKILIEQVQLAQKLQKEAEKEADAAMTQLEDFINEQETIEHQEDAKRQELLGKSEGTPETAAQDPPAEKTETQEQATDGAEPDLQRLMKQTDDAKVQEKSSRITVSAPPGLSITEVDSADREKISTDNFTSELSTVVEDELNNDTIVDCDSAYGESSPSKQEVTTHRDEVLRSSGSEYSRTTPPAETRAESGKYSASGTSAVPPVKRKSFSSCSQGSEINIDSDSESDAKSLSSSISQSTASHNVMKSNGSESGRSSVLTSNSTHSNDLENDISDSASDNDGNLSWKRSDISSDTDDVVDCQINNIMSVHEPTDASDTYSVDELSIKSGSTYLRTELVLKNENTLHVQSNIITPPSAERLRTQSTYLSSVTSQSDLQSDTELSALSARSRSTLRSQYKLKLEESKTAAEDRRSRSPSIALMPSNSLDTEQQHEEDKLQADLIKVTSLGLGGNDSLNSSASSVSRASLVDQQIVNTFLKTYSGIVNFKEALTKVMLDKDMMSASQLLTDIEIFEFDRNSKVQPQLEAMTKNVYYMLGEMSSVISSILYNDREPSISSLAIGSREPTSTVVPKSYESVSEYAPPKVSQPSLASQRSSHDSRGSLLEKVAIRELQEQHETLQKQLDDETKKHEDQLSHNTAIMMEMQDTINKLQQELSTLGNVARSPTSTALQTPTESAIMFTRLDSDRNAKTMKRAINEQRLSPGPYREALEQMDDYVSLPAKRLNHLVKKYVHHCRMKDIEDKVKKSNSLNENVFDILDKMEVLQNQRAHRWANKMDEMGSERLRLASLLMDTLDTIEQESGIFLIKPMFSMRRQVENHYKTKLTRPHQPIVSPMREGPAPTPASYSKYSMQSDKRGRAGVTMETPTKRFLDTRPLEGDSVGLIGARMQQEGVPVGGMWAASLSHPRSISEENVYNQLQLNTPRILELDINRMLIGQNNISTMSSPPLSDDRLVNAAQNSLRSYITVNRPVVQPGQVVQERTRPTVLKENTAPPSTPQYLSSAGSRRMKLGDVEIPRALSSTPPLPPITPTSAKESSEHRAPDPPLSPPGSSLHQSPLLYESPMRQNTRSSARTLATSFSEYD